MGQSPAAAPARHPTLTRTVVAGAVGNVLEWYDFGLFGFLAPVLSRLFLPAEDPLASLLATYGIFAAGFLVRPAGGVVFGYIGDRVGRKLALELSVLLMAVSTTLLGLLPTYAQAGLTASVLLTVLRLLQGLSVGGEYIGSMSFLAEHAPPGRRAFLGSWSGFSVVLGSLMGSGVAACLTGSLSEAQLTTWGWRLPFLSGALIGVVGMWLRLGVEESPSFLKTREAGGLASNPFAAAVREDLGGILLTLGLTALAAIGFYLPFIWLPTWLAQINRPALPEHEALIANTVALLALLVLTPLTAWVSDHVGRKPMFFASAVGFAVLSYPLFSLMADGTFTAALWGGLGFAGCSGLFAGCMAATFVELFPTRTRYTGVAVGYNVGQALLGGTAPLIATGLIKLTGDVKAPAFYLAGCGLVVAVASLFIRARHGQPLD
jgi:MHS family proline/betaine transporter-like MFS transporter